MRQKLSLLLMRMIRSSPSPAMLFHKAAASSSSLYTVTSSLSLGKAKSRVSRVQACSIASGLK